MLSETAGGTDFFPSGVKAKATSSGSLLQWTLLEKQGTMALHASRQLVLALAEGQSERGSREPLPREGLLSEGDRCTRNPGKKAKPMNLLPRFPGQPSVTPTTLCCRRGSTP